MAPTAIPINCTPEHIRGGASATDKMIGLLAKRIIQRGAKVSSTLRMNEYDILPAWPRTRETATTGPGCASGSSHTTSHFWNASVARPAQLDR